MISFKHPHPLKLLTIDNYILSTVTNGSPAMLIQRVPIERWAHIDHWLGADHVDGDAWMRLVNALAGDALTILQFDKPINGLNRRHVGRSIADFTQSMNVARAVAR